MSHFSTVKTELRQLDPLVQALKDMGYSPEQGERPVRGYQGQTVTADLAVTMQVGGDLGFRWNSNPVPMNWSQIWICGNNRFQSNVFWQSSHSAMPSTLFWLLLRMKASRLLNKPKLKTARSN